MEIRAIWDCYFLAQVNEHLSSSRGAVKVPLKRNWKWQTQMTFSSRVSLPRAVNQVWKTDFWNSSKRWVCFSLFLVSNEDSISLEEPTPVFHYSKWDPKLKGKLGRWFTFKKNLFSRRSSEKKRLPPTRSYWATEGWVRTTSTLWQERRKKTVIF